MGVDDECVDGREEIAGTATTQVSPRAHLYWSINAMM